MPLTQISLTLSRHFSLLFIASGRSSRLHSISSHSSCMYVQAGRPAFAWPSAGVHRSTSLMSSSLLLQQCPACLVCLTWIVFMMGGRWPYSWCLVGCCCQDLFNIAPADLQDYIPYPHIAAVCMFKLVILLLLGHMRESIGVHHLWARPCFSSSVLHVWFV